MYLNIVWLPQLSNDLFNDDAIWLPAVKYSGNTEKKDKDIQLLF